MDYVVLVWCSQHIRIHQSQLFWIILIVGFHLMEKLATLPRWRCFLGFFILFFNLHTTAIVASNRLAVLSGVLRVWYVAWIALGHLMKIARNSPMACFHCILLHLWVLRYDFVDDLGVTAAPVTPLAHLVALTAVAILHFELLFIKCLLVRIS